MSQIVTVADALVTSLNGASWTIPFTAVREFRPDHSLEDLKTIKVTVVPKSVTILTPTRGMQERLMLIDVGIQFRLSKKTTQSAEDVEVADRLALVDEIVDHIFTVRTFGEASWVNTINEPIFDPSHIREERVFTSVLTMTFRVYS